MEVDLLRTEVSQWLSLFISSSVEYLHFSGNKVGGRRLRGRREERRLQGRREL
ncbi:MAG: hypothetical protein F6J96_13900 [Symploca sp. SIO1C2]|nr:hypothetical protein [Symploca sp. SIO1C2]NER48493.1 hypothetical protein [Symploca sp. SIO1A3]